MLVTANFPQNEKYKSCGIFYFPTYYHMYKHFGIAKKSWAVGS